MVIVVIVIVIIIIFSITNKDLYSGAVGNKIIKMVTGKLTSWNPSYFSTSKEYSDLWRSKKEEIKNQIKYLKPNETYNNTAVVHFRCSDVPFEKHPEYTLLPKEYFKFVSDKIKERNVKDIVIVTCNTHNPDPLSYKCVDYSSTIKKWLEDFTSLSASIDNSCQSIKDTYEIFLGSKMLISTGGSFSFVPGITKGKDFVSPSLLADKPTKGFENLHKLVHWTMWDKFDRIPHSVDYETFIYE